MEKIHRKLQYYVSLAKNKAHVDWEGRHPVEQLFVPYLLAKYKSECLIKELYIYFDPEYTYGHDEFVKDITDCIKANKSRIIVIPVSLFSRHANLLIYRQETKQFEHFEPHGSSYNTTGVYTKQIQNVLESLVSRINQNIPGLNSTFHPSYETCPHLRGLQAWEEAEKNPPNLGFCLAWSLFFCEMVLANPSYTSKEVHELIMKLSDGQSHDKQRRVVMPSSLFLRNVIIGYAIHVNDKLEKYYTAIFGFRANLSTFSTLFQHSFRYIHAFTYTLYNVEEMRRAGREEEEIDRFINMQYTLLRTHPEYNQNMEVQFTEFIKRVKSDNIFQNVTPKSITPLKVKHVVKRVAVVTPPKGEPEKKEEKVKLTPPPSSANDKDQARKKSPKKCPEGSFLNERTNRCNKIKTQNTRVNKTVKKSPKKCPEGSFLNERTNRCNKIKTKKK